MVGEAERGGRLAGRAALVTGGGSGLGAAIARRFAAEGARVMVAGRRLGPLEGVAGTIGGCACAADMTVEDDVRRLMAECERALGGLDVLVNNAGVPGPILPVERMAIAAWDAAMAANVRSVVLASKHALPLLKRRPGVIVNMSSRVGLPGYGGVATRSAYVATKAAILGITEAVAHEVGRFGVRVNSLCPSAVRTEFIMRNVERRAAAEKRSVEDILATDYVAVTALRRMVEERDVADAALFLASDEAGAVTSTHLKVDAMKT